MSFSWSHYKAQLEPVASPAKKPKVQSGSEERHPGGEAEGQWGWWVGQSQSPQGLVGSGQGQELTVGVPLPPVCGPADSLQ